MPVVCVRRFFVRSTKTVCLKLVAHVVKKDKTLKVDDFGAHDGRRRDEDERGIKVFGLVFFEKLRPSTAKLVLILMFSFTFLFFTCLGVIIGCVFHERILGFQVSPFILARAARAATISFIGITVTIVGVVIHASGASEAFSVIDV